jgi:protein LSM14
MAKLGPVKTPQQTDGATDNLMQKVNQMRLQDQQQRGARGSSRGRGAPRGGHRGKQIEVPKEDFDFESSNAKFNKQELVKEAIATGSPNPLGSPIANGDNGDPLAAAGANGHTDVEADKADEDVVIPPADKGYDKKSSFFDNISSDLKDRVEAAQQQDAGGPGFDGRAMRSQERSKNLETFGQSNVEGGGYRGGYRGRGRGYRGGYDPNYRGRGGYRGRAPHERGGYRGRGRGNEPNPNGMSVMPI